jgi:hypothetical protein
MSNTTVSFTKQVIGELDNSVLGADINTLGAVGDINSDGLIDVVVCGRDGMMVWFENPGKIGEWPRHLIANIKEQECGGIVIDLNGDGYPDLINGNDWRGISSYWWENPGPKGGEWKQRTIFTTGHNQFHDVISGKVTGDGRTSIIWSNQGGNNVYWSPIPEDPTQSPWPSVQLLHHFVDGKHNEGLAIADVDGDGVDEVICSNFWFKYTGTPGQEWDAHQYAPGNDEYTSDKVIAGDIDGDGKVEIIITEGDACIYNKPGGKMAIFKQQDDITQLWDERIIETDLKDPHSLQLGDICGNGHMDILVGEVGLFNNPDYKPRIMVYENDGKGNLTRHIIDEGTGIHEAFLVDTRNIGVLDIVGKPLTGKEMWKVHVYYNNRKP